MTYRKDLVEKAIHGDKEAFSILYDEIYNDLYKMAVYMTGNATTAEDIVSDTIVDAYKGIEKLKECERFEGWVLKILSRKAKRHFKRSYNSFSIYNPKAVDIEDVNIKVNCDNDLRIDILNAMSKLKPIEKSIVTLCVIEGYSSKDVGNFFDLNPNTVRSKLNRSLEKIKQSMGGM